MRSRADSRQDITVRTTAIAATITGIVRMETARMATVRMMETVRITEIAEMTENVRIMADIVTTETASITETATSAIIRLTDSTAIRAEMQMLRESSRIVMTRQ